MKTEVEQRFEAVRNAARLAIEKPPKIRRSIKTQLILDVRDDIATMRAKDWSWADIAKEFHPTIGASAETIRQVIADASAAKKARKTTTARKQVEQPRASSEVLAPEQEKTATPAASTTPREVVSKTVFPSDSDL